MSDLALLHELGREWTGLATVEDLSRVITARIPGLTGAEVGVIALYDPARRELAAISPAVGVPDEVVRRLRYVVQPEHRSLWNFRTGRACVSNDARNDPRLVPAMVAQLDLRSVALVPLIADGAFLGLLAAANRPAGFGDAEVQMLTSLSGPAATFLQSRQARRRQQEHAVRLQRVASLAGELAGSSDRLTMLRLALGRLCQDLALAHASFHAVADDGVRLEAQAGDEPPPPADLVRWALRGGAVLQAPGGEGMQDVAAPVRGGDAVLGVLALRRRSAVGLPEEELSLVSAVAGQVAAALLNIESAARTGRLARQMATLYELGLETSATRDLARLYARAAEEAGRLIDADHASVLRLHPERGRLELFASWARQRPQTTPPPPVFDMGEGVAGRVARDRVPALVNDPAQEPDFVSREAPVGRLLCVPVAYHDRDAETPVVFGVLNATREPGGAPFTPDDLEYLNRFATQLAIAAANSVALAGERARSDQLALVNRVLREVAGSLSRERVLDTATRAIQEAFGFPTVLLVVPDADAGVNRIAAACGHTLPPRGLESYPLEAGVAARVIRDRKSVVLNDVTEAADYLATVPTTRSEAMVPVLAAGEVVALLDVQTDAVGAFDRGMVLTLETLADGIAIALRNADLYQALERTNAQLLELDRMKSELVHIVAHDFRAPLAGVMGNAELLEWRPDAAREERVAQAREILHAAEHMSAMVQKTLQTTRLESGQFRFQFGLVDLAATVRAVAARLPDDPRRPIELELPEDPVPCWADGERVMEVLENLLSNARRFAPDGGPIVVALAREGDSALVSVTDPGIGIEPRHHARLFRPFSRVREGRAAEMEGSGLGLYLCERIVRAHGGMLSLASQLGRGSTFTFSLPLFGLAAQTRPPLLLVATRDEATRRAVRGLAAELGYGVHEVADGVAAVEAAARLLPAGVLADRVLPRLGAPEIAQRLRDSPATRAIPVLALAAADELGEGAALMAACLPRPVERAALADALAALAARP